MEPVGIVLLLAGLLAGTVTGVVFTRMKIQAQFARLLAEKDGLLRAREASLDSLKEESGRKGAELAVIRDELSVESQRRASLQTELKLAYERVNQERQLLNDAKKELSDAFAALSANALKNSNEEFITLAKGTIETMLAQTRGQFGEHEAKVENMVKPLHESLKRYEEQITQLENKRREDYGGLSKHIAMVLQSSQELQLQTRHLSLALKSPQVRGRWGEVQLKRLVELAGMSQYCDFSEQVSVETDKGRLRPDMVVHLPSKRDIVVDSKVSLNSYIEAVAAESDEDRRNLLKKHSDEVRQHMYRLSQKAYWEQFDMSPEFVILFLPGESFFSAALENDHTLIEDGIGKNVVISTPTTLIALLRAIAYGWRQELMARNAEEISKAGKALYERLGVFIRHLGETSKSLNQTVTNFNKTISSMDSRVFPSVRKLKELGISSGEDVAGVEQVTLIAREPVTEIIVEESTDTTGKTIE